MPEANIVRAVVKGTLFGQVQTRNMFVGNYAMSEGDTLNDLCQGYCGTIYSAIRGILGGQFTTHTLETQTYAQGHWFTFDEASFVWAGSGSGEQLLNQAAVVLVAKISGSYAHGRKFFSGISENAAEGNSLSSIAFAVAAAALVAYVSPYTSEHGGYFNPGILLSNGTFRTFTSGFVATLLGSMRRRKPGLGI